MRDGDVNERGWSREPRAVLHVNRQAAVLIRPVRQVGVSQIAQNGLHGLDGGTAVEVDGKGLARRADRTDSGAVHRHRVAHGKPGKLNVPVADITGDKAQQILRGIVPRGRLVGPVACKGNRQCERTAVKTGRIEIAQCDGLVGVKAFKSGIHVRFGESDAVGCALQNGCNAGREIGGVAVDLLEHAIAASVARCSACHGPVDSDKVPIRKRCKLWRELRAERCGIDDKGLIQTLSGGRVDLRERCVAASVDAIEKVAPRDDETAVGQADHIRLALRARYLFVDDKAVADGGACRIISLRDDALTAAVAARVVFPDDDKSAIGCGGNRGLLAVIRRVADLEFSNRFGAVRIENPGRNRVTGIEIGHRDQTIVQNGDIRCRLVASRHRIDDDLTAHRRSIRGKALQDDAVA